MDTQKQAIPTFEPLVSVRRHSDSETNRDILEILPASQAGDRRALTLAYLFCAPEGGPDAAYARLFVAAPDHQLIAFALCNLGARWDKWNDTEGEFCLDGLRYATELDEFGVPVVTGGIRAAIVCNLQTRKEQQ